MSARSPLMWIGGIFLGLALLLGALVQVKETQQVLIVRLGKPVRIINAYDPAQAFGRTGAGLALKMPFFENAGMVDKRVLELDMPQQTVLSTDQLRLVVDAFARFRIVDPLRMYQTVGTETNVAETLSRILGSRLRNELGTQPFVALLSPERGQLMDEIQSAVNKEAKRYGAEIVDVRIKRADLPTGDPLESAYARMRTAREQEARNFRAQGSKQAQIIRAEAEAEAARIYANSFGRDTEFYAFYRSMQSYRRTFENGNASVVLSPDNSEYLREFRGNKAN